MTPPLLPPAPVPVVAAAPPVAPQPPPPDVLDTIQTEAETAIRDRNPVKAEALVRLLLSYAENPHTARARELQGVLAERAGRPDDARRAYAEYLLSYSHSEGAERVGQRLAALEPTPSAPPALRPAIAVERKPPRLEVRGVVSQQYLFDRSRSTFLSAVPASASTGTDVRDNVDELLSVADVTATARMGEVRVEARASAARINEFRPVTLVGASRNEGSYSTLNALYLDVADDRLGASARLGRQVLYGSGVFGRFDGLSASARLSPSLDLGLVVGHPTWSSRQLSVDNERTFYGFALGLGAGGGDRKLSVYWFDQRTGGLVDRQAAGVEVRLSRPSFNLYGLAEYDVAFHALNAAFLNATRLFPDGSTLAVSAQYLHAPVLSLTSAVIDQPTPTLSAVRQMFDVPTLRQAARDRSLVSEALTATYSRSLSPKWDAIVDATASRTGGSPASLGVPAFPAAGTEWFLGAQLVGRGLALPRDTWIGGLRFADLQRSRVYAGDLTVRLPLTRRIDIAPRLRAAWRDQRHGTGSQAVLAPSLRMVIHVTAITELEAELGGNFIWQDYTTPDFTGEREEEAFIGQFGYRLRF